MRRRRSRRQPLEQQAQRPQPTLQQPQSALTLHSNPEHTSASPQQVLKLQRIVGNQTVMRQLGRSERTRSSAIQRRLTLDQAPITAYSDLDSQAQDFIIKQCTSSFIVQVPETVATIISEIIASGEQIDCSLPELAQLVSSIGQVYLIGEDVQDQRAQQIGLRMRQNDERISEQSGVFGKGLASTGRGNALATLDLMEEQQGLMRYMEQIKLKFIFNSSKAKGIGGMYGDGVVHLEDKLGKEPKDVFLRTLIHEIGHATFQQRLLKDKLDPQVSQGDFGDIQQEITRLDQEITNMTQGQVEDMRKVKLGRMQNLWQQTERMGELVEQQELLQRELQKFEGDGLAFYNAWLVLRQDEGRYMLGVDLGSVMNPTGRQKYQAEKFEEFCAESFMHIVKEPQMLYQHVDMLRENGEVPGNVINAWDTALDVLRNHYVVIRDS